MEEWDDWWHRKNEWNIKVGSTDLENSRFFDLFWNISIFWGSKIKFRVFKFYLSIFWCCKNNHHSFIILLITENDFDFNLLYLNEFIYAPCRRHHVQSLLVVLRTELEEFGISMHVLVFCRKWRVLESCELVSVHFLGAPLKRWKSIFHFMT